MVDEKLAESVRKFPILYDKSSKDFKEREKKERAWDDVAKEVGFPSGKSFMDLYFLDFRTGSMQVSCTFEQAGLNLFNVCRISCFGVLITTNDSGLIGKRSGV